MKAAALDIPSLKDKVSPEEWAARVDLAAAYRLVALFGWEDLVLTHISMRVPGNGANGESRLICGSPRANIRLVRAGRPSAAASRCCRCSWRRAKRVADGA